MSVQRRNNRQVSLCSLQLRTFPDAMPKSAHATATPAPASYESALAELDRLVQAMESAQLPLDQLLDSYRRGAALLGHCRSQLDAVEQQVRVLDDGQLQPWNDPT